MTKHKISNQIVVFIDWGTTNFRAYKYNLKKNKILHKIETNTGIVNLKRKKQYIDVILETLRKFRLKKNQYILMAGMVGSKKGLYEVPYVSVPITLKKMFLKISMKKILNIEVRIVPGLFYKKNNFFDVIRGEETLAIGAISKLKIKKQCYLCCPGTHSKWISINNNKFNFFNSYMSGEIYSAISKGTILSQSLEKNSNKFSKKYFIKGLSLIKKGYSFPNMLFKVRTMDLFNQANPDQCNSFLSGLVIGLEINDIFKKKDIYKSPVILIASGPLTKMYSISLNYYKIKYSLVNADECFISGMQKIYESNN